MDVRWWYRNVPLLVHGIAPRKTRRWLWPLVLAAAGIAAWIYLGHADAATDRLQMLLKTSAIQLASQPCGAVIATLVYALAGAAFVPVTLLATAALTVFGMWPGIPVAWLGGILGAVLSHSIGRAIGKRVRMWLPGQLGDRLQRLLTRRAFWSVVLMRVIPLGNFAALNLTSGAMKVPLRSFVFGNIVGLLPGLIGLAVIVNRVLFAVRRPDSLTVIAALGLVATASGLAFWLRHRFHSSRPVD